MKQTAVDYLQDEILQDRMIKAKSIKEWNDVISKAREIEEQQIIDAHLIGLITSLETEATKQATEYFAETYGIKGSDELSKVAEITSFDTSSQTEISDEEIEEMLYHHSNEYAYGFKDAIKWYREQLKKKQ